jgi:hypothetical protein
MTSLNERRKLLRGDAIISPYLLLRSLFYMLERVESMMVANQLIAAPASFLP